MATAIQTNEGIGTRKERIPRHRRRSGRLRARALEATIDQLGDWIGDRRKVFQNVRRTNIMLGLMIAQLGNHADTGLYFGLRRGSARG